MSYIVEIIRPIEKHELTALVRSDHELSIVAEGEGWADLVWKRGEQQALFNFTQGRISITTPNDSAFAKAEEISKRVGAVVFGEEDERSLRPASANTTNVRATWIGWPLLVLILTGLLIWKW